ncbi:hypothetical protein [Streptomyces sp. V4I2]|uniref:hypothetical protein n=1 Tax=Streptomyces sp. V4I2 TaxID=3042280 RepID=UPI0027D7F079|nr:hypothetical protein [Streptomyces sp. V4I2]
MKSRCARYSPYPSAPTSLTSIFAVSTAARTCFSSRVSKLRLLHTMALRSLMGKIAHTKFVPARSVTSRWIMSTTRRTSPPVRGTTGEKPMCPRNSGRTSIMSMLGIPAWTFSMNVLSSPHSSRRKVRLWSTRDPSMAAHAARMRRSWCSTTGTSPHSAVRSPHRPTPARVASSSRASSLIGPSAPMNSPRSSGN